MPDVVKFVAYVKSNYARVVGHKCPTYNKQHFLFCRPQGFYKGFRQPETLFSPYTKKQHVLHVLFFHF